jgi:hypothetical protein
MVISLLFMYCHNLLVLSLLGLGLELGLGLRFLKSLNQSSKVRLNFKG